MHLPNIERALDIQVTKSGDEYRADARILPGTPRVGRGKTEDAAKYNLCVNLLYIVAKPDDGLSGGDRGYKPIILKALNDDIEKFLTDSNHA